MSNDNISGPIVFDIEQLTRDNRDWRRVLTTGPHTQVVLMSLPPRPTYGHDIPWEMHQDTDQFIKIEHGKNGLVLISKEPANERGIYENAKSYSVESGWAIVVPAGYYHRIVNLDKKQPLQLYTNYSPPHHKHGLVQYQRPQEK